MKIRLDKFLADNGFYDSREMAKRAILAGDVLIDDIPQTKAGKQIDSSLLVEKIKIKKPLYPYVSRGGLKLEKGLEAFSFDPAGLTILDIGASTGGFTDCLLQNGAKHVYSVDVGYGQLAYKLREDDRVSVLERTNFRKVPDDFIPEVDGTVMDVSFISITKLLERIKHFTKPGGTGIWLIKPQFEAGKEKVGKNGIIKDPAVHKEVLKNMVEAIRNAGFSVLDLTISPITGTKGNTEFLVYTKNTEETSPVDLTEKIEKLCSR